LPNSSFLIVGRVVRIVFYRWVYFYEQVNLDSESRRLLEFRRQTFLAERAHASGGIFLTPTEYYFLALPEETKPSSKAKAGTGLARTATFHARQVTYNPFPEKG
jgi:hypothetical protein